MGDRFVFGKSAIRQRLPQYKLEEGPATMSNTNTIERMSGRELLRINSASKSFGPVQALSNVSLVLYEGELLSIVGENGAGKSTLMNIVTGIHMPDSGDVFVHGQKINMTGPLDALKAGIAIVHQEMVNCPHITAAENIFMSNIVASPGILVHYAEMNRRAEALLANFDSPIDPRKKMGDLSVSEQQVLEIVKALSADAKVIIFDEPTSSLTEDEVKRLFEIVRKLQKDGIGIIYISHRMSEIFELSSRVMIMRDGMLVDTMDIADVTQDILVTKMTGRTIEEYAPPKTVSTGEIIFEVFNYSGTMFHGISFYLRKYEILGFSGLIGAGRSELLKALAGLLESDSGSVKLDGKTLRFAKYAEALKQGIVYLTEDRKTEGLFLKMNIMRNMSILNINKISGRILINRKLEYSESEKYYREMNVRAFGLDQTVGTLSGGNQQKVLIGNALSVDPKIIILDEPTRGIDVGAKSEIYRHLRKLANSGVGVIIISSDLPEIMSLCDRVCIMYEGNLCGEVSGSDINEQRILQIASGL
jgi:ribose transport system ATP-binding protein